MLVCFHLSSVFALSFGLLLFDVRLSKGIMVVEK